MVVENHRAWGGLAWGLLSVCFVLVFSFQVGFFLPAVQAQECSSTPVEVGYRDFKFRSGDVTTAPTEAKPESKLWYNDGFWWGILWSPDSLHHRIHRLDLANQCWNDVGPDVDDRPRSSSDVLWDGTKLYVASRAKMNHKSAHGPQGARLYRFSYEPATKSYTLDDGFPVQINTRKSETLVLAKDSTGQLWVTWNQSHKVMINRSLGDDLAWGKPFKLPVQKSSTLDDDICSVIAFGGDRIGIMWSHQPDQKIYFSVHKDNKSDTKWEPREAALADPELGAVADDHINLSVACTEDGTILATTKTSLQAISDPKIFLLKRTLSGEWTRYPFSFGDHKHTRPIVLFNSDTEHIYVVARGLEHPCRIYYKQTHLANPFFPAGFGTVLISSEKDDDVNDPTSTKQCITNESGLLVLASDSDTKRYLHNYIDLNGGVDNQSPVAADDQRTIFEDNAIAIDILANDGDPDGALDPASLTLSTQPAHGTALVNSLSAVVTYTPNADFSGSDIFTYRISDNKGALSNEAIVTITVNELNDPPVAAPDSATTDNATAVPLAVLSNDSDVDHNVAEMVPTISTFPANGTVSVNNSTGEVTYTPSPNSFGTDTFTYTIHDPAGATSNAARVAILVLARPVASDDIAVTEEGVVVDIDILANDTDLDGSLLPETISLATTPSNGTIHIDSHTGVVTYSPETGNFGTEVLTYTVSDDSGLKSNPATITIDVIGPPVAVNDSAITIADTPIAIAVLDNDFDPDGGTINAATLRTTFGPLNGAISINATNGAVTYTPDAGYSGAELIGYKVDDDKGNTSNEALITIRVNLPPVTVDDAATTFEDIPVPINITANDSDPDGSLDRATVEIHEGPLNGTLEINAVTGVVTYSPDANTFGLDFFTYSIRDNDGTLSNMATVSLAVNSLNDPPVAVSDSVMTQEETMVEIPVLENDFDVDGRVEPATIAFQGQPEHGTIVLNSLTGIVSYTPEANFFGSDAFRYTIHDEENASSQVAGVLIIVLSDNDKPIAVNDSAVTGLGAPVDIAVISNDFDIDNAIDASTVAIATPPVNGQASTVGSNGLIRYSPSAGFSGFDRFHYTVRDEGGQVSNSATVVVRVIGPPVARDDTTFTGVGNSANIAVLQNDFDPDGAGLDLRSVVKLLGPFNGSATVDPATGMIHYTPQINFDGIDAVRYTVKDLDGFTSNEAAVTIFVGSNVPPVANDDAVVTEEDTPISIDLTANDTDLDGLVVAETVLIRSGPGHGSAIVHSTGVNYVPDDDYAGQDSFTYVVRDNENASSNIATVSITVQAVNDPPLAEADSASTQEGTAVTIPVTDNDLDAERALDLSSVTITTAPTHGSATVDASSGAISYTPDSGFVGSDSFRYTVRDDNNTVSNEATVAVTVNSNPGGGQSTFVSIEDGQVKVTEVDNNYGAKSTAKVEQNKFVVYLKFRVSGLAGAVARAVVRLRVTDGSSDGGDDGGSLYGVSNTYQDTTTPWDEDELTARNAPLIFGAALASAGAVSPKTEVEFDVTGAIADDGVYSFAISSESMNQVKYFTKEGAHPPQLVVETASGGGGNLPPVAGDDAAETSSGTPVEIDVLSNDTDSDGSIDVTTVEIVSLPAHGSVSISGSTGRITYSPADGFSGQDGFSYHVKDDDGATSAPATVTVTVNGGSAGGEVTFHPIEDGQIKLSAPGKNYGSKGTAKLEFDKFIFYLKFQVSGLQNGVRQALLRLHVGSGSSDGGDDGGSLFSVSNDFKDTTMPWDENSLTASNAPDPGGIALGSAGPVNPSSLVEFDVTSVINGDGFYSFALTNNSTNLIRYSTREGIQPPELFIETTMGGTSNLPPVAENDQAETEVDTPVAIEILANDRDSDGTLEPATVTIGTLPAHGAVSLNSATGVATYTPSSGFTGADQFTYRVEDDRGAVSNEASVAVTVNSAGRDDSFTYQSIEDGQVKVTEPGKNYGSKSTAKLDLDKFLFYLKFQVSGLTGEVEHATLRLHTSEGSSDGGDDGGSLYSVSNTYLASTTPWQEEGLTAGNAPAIAGSLLDKAGAVSPNTVVEFDVSATIQGDGVYSFALASGSTNRVKYFTKEGISPPALFIQVAAASSNQRPIAVNDETATPENIAAVIDVLFNDHDDDGHLDISSVAIIDEPANGDLLVNPNSGVITYTPANGFSGSDVFTYTVRDNDGAESSVATVTIEVIRSGGATTLTFKPSHDAQVKVSEPLKNYGSKTTVKVAQDRFRAYFKFSVSGINGTVTNALLRLRVSDGSSDGSKDGGAVYRVANNFASGSAPWVEENLNAVNAPEITGEPLSSAGSVSVNSTVEFNVSEAIAANGTYSFAIKSTATDRVKYLSKEGAISPELLVEFIATSSRSELDELTLNSRKDGDGQAQAIGVPEEFELHPNYPNPFNGETTIEYAMPKEKRVELLIFNTRGQEVRSLVDAMQSPGHKKVIWNGRDNSGREVGSGIYFLRLEVGNRIFCRKLALQK
ncbi:MAG: Ig-like domain-containing protein [bacterium]